MIECTYYLLAQLRVDIHGRGVALERFVISEERIPRNCPPGTVWAEVQTVKSSSHDRAKETLKFYLDPKISVLSQIAQRLEPSALGTIITP